MKELGLSLKGREKELVVANKKIHELEIRRMVAQDQVVVEEKEVDLQTANLMG